MNENLTVAILFMSIAAAVIVLVVSLLNYRIKIQIIKSGLADEGTLKYLQRGISDLKHETLKWGIIILCAGFGLITVSFLTYPDNSPLPFGIEAVFVAAGFLIYYALISKNGEK